MNADAILSIPLTDPLRLFPDQGHAAELYRELMRQWHPDSCKDPRAKDVAAHINALRSAALGRTVFEPARSVVFHGGDGKTRSLRYRRAHAYELGTQYILSRMVAYTVRRDHVMLFANGIKTIAGLKVPKGLELIDRYLPKVERTFDTDDLDVVVVRKDPDMILARDLLAHCGGALPGVHVAWIMSSCLSLASYLELAGIVHGGITMSTLYVSPKEHSIALLGGWFYANKVGSPITHMPPEVHSVAPIKAIDARKADPRTDIESVKAIGRAMLGKGARTPQEENIYRWLCQPAAKSGIREYEIWMDVLASNGPRRFVKLDVDFDAVYKEK